VAWLAMSSAAIVIVFAAPVPPLVIGMARLGITTLACALLASRVLGQTWQALRADRGAARLWLLSGALLAAHFAMWITSLSLTSVVHATVLVALQPLFAGLFGRMLGDRASWRLYAGIVVALLGTWLLTRSADGADATLVGDALAVLAAAASAAYLIAGRRVGKRVPLTGWLTGVNGLAFLLLAAAALIFEPDWDPASLSGADGLAILWLGLVPGLVGHGLMNWTARHLPVHTVSLAVLLEPVGATLLALAFLDQSVAPIEVAGGAVLVFGAWLANASGNE
jgi:drug/metabolite transporter (DMT)-like permease